MVKLTYISLLLVFAMRFIMAAPALPTVMINPDQESYDLAPYLEMYLDDTNKATINEIIRPQYDNLFIPYSRKIQTQYKNYGKSTWARFQVFNPLQHDVEYFLALDIPNQYRGWKLFEKLGGQYRMVPYEVDAQHILMFPIRIHAQTKEIFYLNNYAEDWVKIYFYLKKPLLQVKTSNNFYLILGTQYGILIALFLHSIFIYFLIKARSYLIYIGFLCVCISIILFKDGWLNRFGFFYITNWWYIHPFRLNLVGLGFFYVLFAKILLQIKEFSPRLNTSMNYYLFASIPLGILALSSNLGSYQFAKFQILSISLYALCSALLAAISGIIVFFKGYKPAIYYLAGMFFLFLGYAVYFLIVVVHILPANSVLSYAPHVGLDLDMILQAIALAVRFNLIRESEITAQQQVIKEKDTHAKLQAETLRQQQQLVTAYARFFPKRFLELLDKKSIIDVHLGDQIEKNMTVLFADLSDFNSILEEKDFDASVHFINYYLNEIGPLVRQYNGFIDKYIGDSILALYDKRSDDALNCAIAMIAILQKLKLETKSEQFKTGIGIHYGSLMVGTIGEQERMDETVISDTVNTASRLEHLNKFYGTYIIITEVVRDTLKENYNIRFLDWIYVKGKTLAIKIYEVFNNDSIEIANKKLTIEPLYNQALNYYFSRQFREAKQCFEECRRTLTDDKVIQLYLERCENFIQYPPMPEWQGIARLTQRVEMVSPI